MTNSFMTLDNAAAEQAGVGGGIQDGGAYTGRMTSKMVTAKTKAKGIEFSLHTAQGDANYLTLYYQKASGEQNPVGFNTIQAIMFCLGLNETTVVQNPIANDDGSIDWYVPEFENKEIGFVLQKTIDFKDNGDEFYKFDIVLPFKASTGQTVAEINTRAQPTQVAKRVENLKVIDKRTVKQEQAGHSYQRAQSNATAARPTSKFDQLPANNGGQAGQLQDDDFPY